MSSRTLKRTGLFAVVIFAVWTTLGLLAVAQSALWRTHRGEPVIWSALVARSMIDWYTCAIFTLFFFWLARQFAIDRRRWRSGIPAHLVGISAAVVLKYAMLVAFWRRMGGDVLWEMRPQ